MRILHVIDSLSPGGAERVLIDLCNILHNRNVDVSVLNLTKREELRNYLHPGIPYFNLDRKSRFDPRKCIRLYWICRRFDIIHVHMRHVLKYTLCCDLILRFPGRILFHDHFGDIKHNKAVDQFMFHLRERFLYVGVSNELKQWAVTDLRKCGKDCIAIPNIVRKEMLASGNEDISNRIILVSNFRRTKNIEYAIELMALLNETDVCYLDIYGQVVDLEYFERIQNLIRQHRLTDRITINTTTYSIQQVLPKYSFAFHTSRSETGPLVLIEYLAQGLPFLAFETGEVAAIVRPWLPNLFIDEFCVRSWIERFRLLLEQSQSIWKTKMKQVYDTEFSEEAYYQKWKSTYEQMMNY